MIFVVRTRPIANANAPSLAVAAFDSAKGAWAAASLWNLQRPAQGEACWVEGPIAICAPPDGTGALPLDARRAAEAIADLDGRSASDEATAIVAEAMQAARAAAELETKRLRALLRRCESVPANSFPECPICEVKWVDGPRLVHRPDCELAAAIAGAE